MMLCIILVLVATAATVTQLAVLRDKSIVEPELVESLRYLRIAGYSMACLYVGYLATYGLWLQPPLAISLIAISFADTAGAAGRLFPEMLTPNGNE